MGGGGAGAGVALGITNGALPEGGLVVANGGGALVVGGTAGVALRDVGALKKSAGVSFQFCIFLWCAAG